MSSGVGKKEWQELYLAALFETDESKTAGRIADAERMIVERARSLFHHPNSGGAERDALHAALHALSALKLCARVEPRDASERKIA
jgi:hypothetical protein